ncbi:hypothetical protein QC761_207195 [Podospora bellae-mahoneyi]|uniref:Ecp2 effector protein domain-containing protein n=1 Tax=Podospora bellae-mahoneyi TaxID=2093777 RepID=A0ABR0FRY5_9PEZI|nr:hypothetical protein QC761_207195 [Podospora bellae-mahoneyi]
MKLQSLCAITLATLTPLVTANFDIYMAEEKTTVGGPQVWPMWHIFDTDPTCDDLADNPNYLGSDDVSGNKVGVRCESSSDPFNCAVQHYPADGIDVLEMNFHSDPPVYHWKAYMTMVAIYKDRNYDMYGLDGNVYGNCFPFPGFEYECGDPFLGGFTGTRKFRCLTEFTAAQIKAAWGTKRSVPFTLKEAEGVKGRKVQKWEA